MKLKRKKTFWSSLALLASVVIFYAGTMSLRVEENLAGEEYSILLNGNVYEGTIEEDGIVNFPWNPFRKGGLATIEISRKESVPFRAAHNFKPSFGRHIIFSDESEWANGHIVYLFGMPIRESLQSHIFLHPAPIQNQSEQGNPITIPKNPENQPD